MLQWWRVIGNVLYKLQLQNFRLFSHLNKFETVVVSNILIV